MANGFPVSANRQSGNPISSSDINAIAAAVNQTAAAKVAAAGELPIGAGLNLLGALAAPTVDGLVLTSKLDQPLRAEWGLYKGFSAYTAAQTSPFTMDNTPRVITGMSVNVEITRENSLVAMLTSAEVDYFNQPSGSPYYVFISGVIGANADSNAANIHSANHFGYNFFTTIASKGTITVTLRASCSGGGKIISGRMIVLVL